MKKVLVLGAGGFLGTHLIARLKAYGYAVIGVDRKAPEFETHQADDFLYFDLRNVKANDFVFRGVDEVYQLACEVGGLGYIMNKNNDAEMLRNSMLVNLNVLEACRHNGVKKVFFASSACVYPSLTPIPGTNIHGGCREVDAWPYQGDNFYAHEKMFAELLYDSYSRNHAMDIHIARFHNFYGPLGTWRGGREKAPAAICRKVAEAQEGGSVEVWGDGSATRSFMHVDDCVEGTLRLMNSGFRGPVNIGSSEMVTIAQMTKYVIEVSGKNLNINYVPGPVGVQGRNSDNTLILEKLGWQPSIPLWKGLAKLYPWVRDQVLTHAGT